MTTADHWTTHIRRRIRLRRVLRSVLVPLSWLLGAWFVALLVGGGG